MAGYNQGSLGEFIREWLSEHKLDSKLKKARIIEAWPEVTGKMITNHTLDLSIKGTTLFAKLDSPALKTELSYSKNQIIDSLNAAVGEEIISEIVFT